VKVVKNPRLCVAACGLAVLAGCNTEDHGRARHMPGPNPDAPFSASVAHGDLVFLSGKLSPQRGDITAEARGAILQVEKELLRHKLTLADVVQATIYLADITDYDAFNAVYTELMPKPYPARAAFAVAALPRGARVEIRVIAAR